MEVLVEDVKAAVTVEKTLEDGRGVVMAAVSLRLLVIV